MRPSGVDRQDFRRSGENANLNSQGDVVTEKQVLVHYEEDVDAVGLSSHIGVSGNKIRARTNSGASLPPAKYRHVGKCILSLSR